jgi:hypothetical protein
MSRTKSKSRPAAEPRWKVIRLKKTPAAFVGYVTAPDQASAIRKAAAEFKIPEALRDKLAAYRTA